jgi:transcriptional regulator of acetoin/glycerol metabolism
MEAAPAAWFHEATVKDAGTEREDRSSAPRVWQAREPHLFIVLEGGRPTAGGLRCSLRDASEVVVGRSEMRSAERDGKRITVGIPDRRISACHARLVRRGVAWRLEDAGSTNGTLVNGRAATSVALADGDLIVVGRTAMRLRLELPTPSGTPDVAPAYDTLGLGTLLPALAGEHDVAARIARSRVPVVLRGETGTGKEVTSRAVHAASGRRGDFVAVNCAALTDSLVEGQLFGHLKGAFSGASSDAVGFVRAAHQGTLFLDEIGDLPLAAQGVLLRVLQEGEVVPVGAARPVPVDLRVIAATHQPIEAMIERGDFRHDLFARLQGFTHRLWPLRDRREDVGVLVAETIRRIAKDDAEGVRLSGDAVHALVTHDWPLNVRELVQVLSRAHALAVDGAIELDHLGPALAGLAAQAPSPLDPPQAAGLSAEDAELRATLIAHLRRLDGNVAGVARDMNRATMQVYRWMNRLGIDPKRFR